jgi:hypothetical protein
VVSLLEQGRQRAVCEGLDHRGDDPEELSTGYPRAHAPHTAALVSPTLAAVPLLFGYG